ncbi:hypothetical protein [Burkholderia pseudomallei]|uniref:hypothetical protein n=1 Tax=Burkholderia pseudomallei TaxID=28450 RepID=UPI000F1CC2DD|nr:hypothetical protein [Burkholderia pseudomallei]VBD43370.1 Uncharacterised protein [Burkholderia pseudomallei]
MKVRTIVSIFPLLCLLLSFSPGVRADDSTFWISFLHNGTVVSDPRSSPAATSLTKSDIVIFGDDITIDSPVRSYGGDILIVADTLKVFAPIDSRPYISFSRAYWPNTEDPHPGLDPAFTFTLFPALLAAYDSYFYWQEIWDSSKFSYVRTVGHPTFAGADIHFDPQPLGPTATLDSAIPYGQTGNGNDAPSVSQPALRAGSIRIYARHILFCKSDSDGCPPNVSSSPSQLGGPYDFDKTGLAFMADGISGPLGAPPPLVPCGGPAGACAQYDTGLSGLAGPGQDAGSVRIVLMDESAAKVSETSLRSSAHGGNPAYVGRFSVGSLGNFSRQDRGAIVYHPELETRNRSTLFGADGPVSVEASVDYSRIVTEIASELAHMAQGKEYQLEPMVAELQQPEPHLWLVPRAVLLTYLRNEIVRARLTELDSFISLLNDRIAANRHNTAGQQRKNASRPDISYGSIFRGIPNCSARDILGTSADETVYIKQLCLVTANNGSLVSDLLMLGGVFHDIPRDVSSVVNQNDMSAELGLLNTQAAQAVTEIEKVGNELALIYQSGQRQQLVQDLNAAKQALAHAQAEIQQNGNALSTIMSAAGLAKVVASMVSIGSAFDAAATVLNDSTKSWSDAQQAFQKNKGSSADFVDLFTAINNNDVSNDTLAAVARAVKEASDRLSVFDRDVAAANAAAASRMGAQTKQVVDLGSKLEGKWAENILYFDQMVRAVFQTYITSPNGDINALVNNLVAVRDRFFDPTQSGVALNLSDVPDLCSADGNAVPVEQLKKTGCAKFMALPSYRRIYWGHVTKDIEVPFIVVGPADNEIDLTVAIPRFGKLREERIPVPSSLIRTAVAH